jgi:HlyD family secretion protein
MKKVIVISILGMGMLFSACKQKYKEAAVKTGPVTEAVFASGSIEPKDVFIMTSLSDGFIIKSNVVENDIVKPGQLLFELDNKQQHVQVDMARKNLQYSQVFAAGNSPTLLQIKANIEAARAKMQTDSVNAHRYEKLWGTHSVSKQEYDNMVLNYTTSKSNYNMLLESYKSSAEKVRQDLDNSKANLDNAQAGNQYYQLSATGYYRVYQIYKKTGELVKRGEQVAQLGNPDSIIVSMDIDEGSIAKIQMGQQVIVELNTLKNKTFAAHISKIYPHFNDKNQSYKVEAKFDQITAEMIAGTQLQANIITAKKENTLLIPRAFLMNNNKVLLKHGSKQDTTEVRTGILSDEWVEILEGLKSDDTILKEQ